MVHLLPQQQNNRAKGSVLAHHYPPGRRSLHCSSVDTNRSMIPFIRIARFQSFRVDLPAKWTNSLGLMR